MKRLYRSRTDRKVTGLAGGLGEYFGIDANLIRIGFLILTITTAGGFIIAYLIGAAIVPEKPQKGEKDA